MNTIILTLSFVLVVTVYGVEEINIEQVFRNPFLSEVQKVKENRLVRTASLKSVRDGNKNGTRNDSRKQIISENINKFKTYGDKNTDKKIVPKFFSNKEKDRTYDVPSKLMKNSAFVNSPKRSYQERLWNFKNKKDRKIIKSVFPIEKEQEKSTSNISTNKNENITFSSVSSNKLGELIWKLSTGDEKSITRKASPVHRIINAIPMETLLNSTQNVSSSSIKRLTNKNNNTQTSSVEEIKKVGSIGLNMLSNLLGKQQTEELVNVIFNKYPINDSNSTSSPIRKENIENFLTNVLGKKVKKRDTKAFQELAKDDASNLSNNTLNHIRRSSIDSDYIHPANEEGQMLEDPEFERRIDEAGLNQYIIDGRGIVGLLSDGALKIVSDIAELILKQAAPKIISFVYRKLKKYRLFGVIVIHGTTTIVNVTISIIVSMIFLFAAAAFTYAILPVAKSFLFSVLTPTNVTKAYLALIKAFDGAVGLEKIFDATVGVLLKLVKYSEEE